MSDPDRFRTTLGEACERQGWSFDGEGVTVSLGARHQVVTFEARDFEGEHIVRLCATIGDASHIRPHRLADGLRMNFRLPHGALALRGDDLVMVDSVPAEAGADTIALTIRYLAETADHFERTMFGPDEH